MRYQIATCINIFLKNASKTLLATKSFWIVHLMYEVIRMLKINEIGKHIDDRLDEHIRRVQEFLRQPSVSAENYGVRECAILLRNYFEELGCKVAKVMETGGPHPVVYAEYDAGAEKTLLIYFMYDTQPFNEEEWTSPPLEARLVDIEPFGKCVVARGAINSKGPLVAFLNALESIRAVGDELPFNFRFISQGDEELASRYFADFVLKHKDMLKADALFSPDAYQDRKGKVSMELGYKGVDYFELECNGKAWGRGPTEFGIHSSAKSWVDSPVWRMIQALATMTSEDGNKILIDGWYDNVKPLTEEDLQLIDKLAETFDEEEIKEEDKIEQFLGDLHGRDLLIQYYGSTTLNIDGIWGGYTGPGSLTLLPHKVTVKMDVRLVPDQTSEEILPKMRKHLDKHGYTDIIIRPLDPYEWSRESVNEPIVQATIQAYRKMGYEPEISPISGGSVPFYLFTSKPLKIPFTCAGLGYGARAHAPDEYFVIEGNEKVAGLAGCEKSYVTILDELAKLQW